MMFSEFVTASEMKELERKANDAGLSYYQMMENAGAGAYAIFRQEYPFCREPLVICGSGNNGGDGFVFARMAFDDGLRPVILSVGAMPRGEDALHNRMLCEQRSIPIVPWDSSETCHHLLDKADVIVDGLYGTGFHGEFRGDVVRLAEWINRSPAEILSLDIPSGVSADDGFACKNAFKAHVTVTFHAKKYGFLHNPTYFGKLFVADIGICGILKMHNCK